MASPFKVCGCGRAWQSREEFLADPELELVGYQVDLANNIGGLFLFNHTCFDTIAMSVTSFTDLASGPLYSTSMRGTEECEKHCLHRDDLDPCRALCECAHVREVMQVIRDWPKSEKPDGIGK
jgi:hypothetical protein